MKTIRAWLAVLVCQLRGFLREDTGQDMIEYALLAALIALGAVVGMGSVAKGVNDIFSSIGAKVSSYIP